MNYLPITLWCGGGTNNNNNNNNSNIIYSGAPFKFKIQIAFLIVSVGVHRMYSLKEKKNKQKMWTLLLCCL
jgi:hypothetical protein